MSYCRFGWDNSDVYVFMCVSGHLECFGCNLGDEWSFTSTDAMLAHLQRHIDAGHTVPQDARDRLHEEREENDAFIEAGGARSS